MRLVRWRPIAAYVEQTAGLQTQVVDPERCTEYCEEIESDELDIAGGGDRPPVVVSMRWCSACQTEEVREDVREVRERGDLNADPRLGVRKVCGRCDHRFDAAHLGRHIRHHAGAHALCVEDCRTARWCECSSRPGRTCIVRVAAGIRRSCRW